MDDDPPMDAAHPMDDDMDDDDESITPLVHAIYDEEPLDVIQGILQRSPELMQQMVGNKYPMSHALWYGSPPEVLQALCASWPECLLAQDLWEGWVPMHNVNSRTPIETVVLLVDMCPLALRQRSSRGDLPIHTNVEAPIATVRVLVERYPESLLVANDAGHLPLHVAAGREADSDVIAFLVDLRPETVLATTADGLLPVHLALRARSRVGVIQRLAVEAIPEATKRGLMHSTVRFALDTVHMPSYGFLLENVSALKEALPETLRAPDAEGSLPIHVAVHLTARLGLSQRSTVLCHLVATDPESLMERNAAGDLPLHIALDQETSHTDMSRFLMERRPDSLRVAGAGGKLPLHVAVSRVHPSPELVQLLLDGWNGALDVRDANGNLPLRLALSNETAPLEVIYILSRAQPDVLRSGTFLNAI